MADMNRFDTRTVVEDPGLTRRDRHRRYGSPANQPADTGRRLADFEFLDPSEEFERLRLFEAVLARHGGLVTRYVQPFGRPVTLWVVDTEWPDLHEDITAALTDGQVVYRWSWQHAIAGVDLEEQAAAIVAALRTKASFTV